MTDVSHVIDGLRAALDGSGPALLLGAAPDADSHAARAVAPDDAAAVITTSGSTGEPKSVVLSRAAVHASVAATAERIGEGRWLLALSPGYVAGMQVLARSLRARTMPVVLDSVRGGGRFDAAEFVRATASLGEGAGGSAERFTSLVPTQLSDLLDAGAAPALRTYRAVLIGGQAMPEALRERAADADVRVVRTYGSSETAGGCVYDGRPLDGVGARIIDGEVWISGAVLAEGYLGEPERTAAAFVVEGGTRWYRTGDAGTLEHGLLRVTGRRDNVIVSGGVNVSLDRVERVVRGIAGLADAVVVPVSDERWGQASIVVVARVGVDRASTADALLDLVRDRVGREAGVAARPRGIHVVDEIPALTSGKPDRRSLRSLLDTSA